MNKTQLTQNRKATELCMKYSEQPERLKAWLEKNKVEVSDFYLSNPKWDKKPHATVQVTINAGESFPFYLSTNETKTLDGIDARGSEMEIRQGWLEKAKIRTGLLYSILSCVSLDVSCDLGSFQDFCGDFGYDIDSIEALRTFEAIKAQKALLLASGMKEEDCEFLPS